MLGIYVDFTIFVFKYRLADCRPGIKYISASDIKEVLNLGVGFLLIQFSLLYNIEKKKHHI